MRILYGIQATGNGHIARAKEIIPELKKHAEVDILVSGTSGGMDLEQKIKYKKKGFSFAYSDGKIDLVESLKNADFNGLFKDIYRLDTSQYDLIISDFEPITAWAANIRGVKSVGIANQYSNTNGKLRKELPLNPVYDAIVNFFALCDKKISLNYKSYDKNMYTPIIRKEIRALKPTTNNHITVYLWDGINEKAVKVFKEFPKVKWHIFSKDIKREKEDENIVYKKLDNYEFAKSLASSKGTIIGAGFAGTTEALYLGKKMLAIPLKFSPEQQSNALQLEKMGVKTLKKIDSHFKEEITDWLENYYPVKIHYPDVIGKIVKDIIEFAKEK